jgi:beta-aspartyl-dipeptidase (metallo-type)
MIWLRNARVFAPEDLGVQDILIAGGQIIAMGPDLSVEAPLTIDVVDLAGARVTPGLIDAHTHLGGGGGEGGAHTRVPALGLTALTTAGVTTAIGLLGTDGTTRTIADLLAVSRGLDHLGITTFCYTGSYELPLVTLTGSVRGDLVHVDRIVAVGEVAISDHRSSQPTFDELLRIASDAHVAGMMTGKAGLLHLHLGDGRRGLEFIRRALHETELPPRVFHPTHLNRNPDLWLEAREMGRSGGWFDVTAFPDDGSDAPTAGRCLSDWRAAGLPMSRLTLSSDGGGCLPTFDDEGKLLHMDVGRSHSLLDALREAEALGVPFDEALATCTRNVATLFRLGGKGRLAVGMDADLVAFDDDLQPRHVIARGRFLVRDGEPTARGPFERA